MSTTKTVHMRSILWSMILSILLSTAVLANDIDKLKKQIREGALNKASLTVGLLLEQNPKDPIVQFLYATLLEKQGANIQAIEIYKHLTIEFPEYPEPFNNLAIHYANKKDFESAIATLERAFDANPSYRTTYSNLQAIYGRLASEAYIVALNSDVSPLELKLASLDTISTDVIYQDPIVLASVESETKPKLEDKTKSNTLVSSAASLGSESSQVLNEEQALEQLPSNSVISEEFELVATHELELIVDVDEPEIEPAVTKQLLIDATSLDQVKNQVTNWANAWSQQNFQKYLSFYSREFIPKEQITLDDWKEQRRVSLLSREFIVVKLSDLNIAIKDEIATASFLQYYKSSVYEGTERKTLTLKLFNNQWFIVREIV
jgi:tetratricopeptide (TPR) repeat protein